LRWPRTRFTGSLTRPSQGHHIRHIAKLIEAALYFVLSHDIRPIAQSEIHVLAPAAVTTEWPHLVSTLLTRIQSLTSHSPVALTHRPVFEHSSLLPSLLHIQFHLARRNQNHPTATLSHFLNFLASTKRPGWRKSD
jgi:hypothetical protein